MNLKNFLENEIDGKENVTEEYHKKFDTLHKELDLRKCEIGAMKKAFKQLAYQKQTHPPFPWINMAETKQTLHVAERTVHGYIEKGILGRSWFGRKLFFNRKVIEEYLKENYAKNQK